MVFTDQNSRPVNISCNDCWSGKCLSIPGVTPMFLSRFSSTRERLFLPSSAIRSRSLAANGSTKPPPPIPPPSPPFRRCSVLGLLEDVDKLWTELDRDGTDG